MNADNKHQSTGDNNKHNKNKAVTLSQLEQMEEWMSWTLAATIQSLVNSSIDDKLRPIQQSIYQLLENKQKTAKLLEDVTKLVKENKTITYRCVNIEKENKKLREWLNDLENKNIGLLCNCAWNQ